MSVEVEEQVKIEVTEQAKIKLIELGLDEGSFLRLGVRAGGCAGMTYDAVIDDTFGSDDHILYESDGLRVASDQENLVFLQGLKIDYSDDLVKSGFILSNPNVKKSCGCGASFGPTAEKSGGGCGSGGCG
ncbi:MAG: iron-sulfur cluster assembly accessory protein [Lentisphaerae bacterium]|nr:iron-sulfur cluster assembly accessory protein [Lentisphaerota bacterium]